MVNPKIAAIVAKVKQKLDFKRMKDLSDEYTHQWLDAEVLSADKTSNGKATDLKIKLINDYPGLPEVIESQGLILDYIVSKKDKVKVKLHITMTGISVDQLSIPHAQSDQKVALENNYEDNEPIRKSAKALISQIEGGVAYLVKGALEELKKVANGGEYKEKVIREFFEACSSTLEKVKEEGLEEWSGYDFSRKSKEAASVPKDSDKELAEKLLVNLKKKIDTNITKAKIELIKIIEGENYQEGPLREFYKSCMDAIKLLDAEGYKSWHE